MYPYSDLKLTEQNKIDHISMLVYSKIIVPTPARIYFLCKSQKRLIPL